MTLMEKLFEKHMLMNKVKELQKENAELRECLKETVDCIESFSMRINVYDSLLRQNDYKKWHTALEGGNHAND